MTQGLGHRWWSWRIDVGGVAGVLVMTALILLIAVRPMLVARASADILAKEVESLRSDAERVRYERRSLDARLTDVRSQLARQKVRPEPLSTLNQRLAALTEMSTGAGLMIDQFTPAKPVAGPAGRFTAVPLRMAGRGSYRACIDFLRRLHEQVPDTSVVGLRASGNADEPDAPARFIFDLVWYAASPAQPARK